MSEPPAARLALASIWAALGGPAGHAERVSFRGDGALPSWFAVSDLAAASTASAGLAAAELLSVHDGRPRRVEVDRRLSSLWFGRAIEPRGWEMAAPWDAIAGDYEAADGWIKLHTNAPHHRAAALAVLGAPGEKEAVAGAVRRWSADDLETAIVARGGAAGRMRAEADWARHPQGAAVAAEPLVHHGEGEPGSAFGWQPAADRPLRGLRVLDMTRVLAGPVATRFLAGLGAEVLRIDPPDWDEPGVVPDVCLGKRCARLDLRDPEARRLWEGLLAGADILVHGYRPGALDGFGLGEERRRALRPGLIEVSLDAYGWTGPWRGRRGFDSLVQMSCGIADTGMRRAGADRPVPLPVQALDHATGYIMAAAAIRGVTRRLATGAGSSTRASLARTATLLASLTAAPQEPLAPPGPPDFSEAIEDTSWGPARRLRPACLVDGAPLRWDLPASALGSAGASWT
ncbi:CoA transferase [Enterovirga rhinocerotis]|uniref:CoA transferase family III n=1 Tax=Enterovirga rhinocerotis TaxID=1339210 RepID=A0A4R7C4T3_9HYPH|nr:CoA transferase [Enterovirga rhinocerotis]TDR93033.1 CoA transferase family III [Enterovirga rhinocerotis]